jgi:serine/threonine-protein kinase
MLQALEGLGAAHNAGIVHRDLKPDNIFLLRSRSGMADFVKILDFGVSKFSQTSGDEMNVTRAGAVVGTPYYMSPEQARGMSTIDARSDVYALGVLLYQASTGQVPFQATTFNELLFKIALDTPPPPQHYVPDLDPDFAAIIVRAMAREPAHRFQSCFEFRDALIAWQATHTSMAGTQVMPMFAPPGFNRPQTYPPGYLPVPPPAAAPAAPEGPQATANAWGHASSTSGAAVPKKSNALLIASAAAGIAVLGLGLAVYLFLGSPAGGEATGTTAAQQPAPTVEAPVAAPVPAPAPPPPASAAKPVEPEEEPLQFEPVPASPPAQAAKPAAPVAPARPAAPPTPRPTATGAKKPAAPGDFGY